MLSQIKSALVCCAGLLYGCGGFTLSVLAAGLDAIISLAFDRPPQRSALPVPIRRVVHRRRSPQRVPSPSRRSTATSVASSEAPQTPKIITSEDQPIVASSSESSQPSSPSRDYFSTFSGRKKSKASGGPPLRRCSLGESSVSPPSSADSHESLYQSADERSSTFKLKLGLKKRERAKSMPRSQTIQASTQAKSSSSTSSSAFSLVKGATFLSPKALCPKPAKRKNLRKVPSVPSTQLPTLRVWPASPTVKKKQSQPLRTQPYEAPYFCPIPTHEQPLFKAASTHTRRASLPS